MTVKSRFAPSPTGKIHVGNIRAALVTWLFTRKNEGHFFLRIDDTDLERSKEEYVDALQTDLKWLGLTWDSFARQSERWDRYNAVIAELKEKGRLYPCYETEEELALMRKTLISRGKPPIYDRKSLNLSAEDLKAYEDEGRTPHWRFKLEETPIEWHDKVRGAVKFHGKDLSDPVLIRADGSPLYHLCSVIDDIDFEITHVVRGEDHVANTATHVQMFEAIGAKVPEFAHYALLSGKDGGKLSKRLGALGVEQMRDEMGFEPMAINSLIAKLGTSDNIDIFTSLEQLIEGFDFSKFGRSMARFDHDDLERLNTKLIQDMSFADAETRLKQLKLNDVDEDFWMVARRNISRLSEVKEWWDVTRGNVEPKIDADDKDFVATISNLLPQGTWDENTWGTWLSAIKENTDRKGKSLFMPIRKALTGMEHGPELRDMLPLIGSEKAVKRLMGETA